MLGRNEILLSGHLFQGHGFDSIPRAAIITPTTSSLRNSTQLVSSRVANKRSAVDGVPPRWRCPRIVSRDSWRVSLSSCWVNRSVCSRCCR